MPIHIIFSIHCKNNDIELASEFKVTKDTPPRRFLLPPHLGGKIFLYIDAPRKD